MDFRDRPLAIVDIETTGDDELTHEILEIGVVVAKQTDWHVIHARNWLIKPHHIETAVPAALERNGYKEEDWREARELADVMPEFAEITVDAVFTAYNATFDWSFIKHAFRTSQTKNRMDYHRLDVMSMAWERAQGKLGSISLKSACQFYGVEPETDPHRALNGAEAALRLLRKILDHG